MLSTVSKRHSTVPRLREPQGAELAAAAAVEGERVQRGVVRRDRRHRRQVERDGEEAKEERDDGDEGHERDRQRCTGKTMREWRVLHGNGYAACK